MKKKVLLVFIIICIALAALSVLSSCDMFGGGGGGSVVIPTIESVELLKNTANYTSSNEYLYNKDKNNSMAVYAGNDILISIKYNNPKSYAVSYVTINNDRITPSEFEKSSTKTNTIVKVTVPETLTPNSKFTYTIKNVFFNTGSEIKKMQFASDVAREYTVNVSPTYRVTLNWQNADNRAATLTAATSSNPTTVNFGVEMSTVGVVNKDYTKATGLPQKAGGWIFEGWFTEPNGEGIPISSTDTYYFWSNITLYAYFTRLFEYEIVQLDTPIVDSATGTTYRSGVIITKDNSRGKYPIMNIDDTIVDEKVIVDQNGRVNVTYIEYPVVGIGNKAFKDVNNIETLTIGKFVTEIGAHAFDNCNKLVSASFNNGSQLKYIGDYAFQNTKSLAVTSPGFTLPESLEYIGNFAFRYSAWKITNNNGVNESVLHIKPQYKFIGALCFFDTGFNEVVFDAGCHFESQISDAEANEIEKAGGWDTIKPELNRIGAGLFAKCRSLTNVTFNSDGEANNALNIIPDKCFDAGNYPVEQISYLMFNEGLEFIGMDAFNYQTKLTSLEIPATVTEIGIDAFYNCSGVTSLTFKPGSRLEILHTRCFGNLIYIDRVIINSAFFTRYGNGPFNGCRRLKSIEFPYLNDPSQIPTGYLRALNKEETAPGHVYSDFLYGTFESEEGDAGSKDLNSGYSNPTRIFCRGTVLEKFKKSLILAKTETTEGSIPSAVSYENRVFVHNIDLIRTFEYEGAGFNEDKNVSIALQPVYENPSKIIKGYSLVYWSARNANIVLPGYIDGLGSIIEISAYAIPTSVVTLTVPQSVIRIAADALNGCARLENVIYEDKDTLQYIGDFAFCGTAIQSFEGGEKLAVIGKSAFRICRSLKWVDLSRTAIENRTNKNGDNLRDEVIKLYKYDYELKVKDKGNKETDAPDHKNGLFDDAFKGCSSLEWVYLPKNIEQLSAGTFDGCEALRTVIIEAVIKAEALDKSKTNHQAFYQANFPLSIYDDKAVYKMTIYVPTEQRKKHEQIFDLAKYDLFEKYPKHPG